MAQRIIVVTVSKLPTDDAHIVDCTRADGSAFQLTAPQLLGLAASYQAWLADGDLQGSPLSYTAYLPGDGL